MLIVKELNYQNRGEQREEAEIYRCGTKPGVGSAEIACLFQNSRTLAKKQFTYL